MRGRSIGHLAIECSHAWRLARRLCCGFVHRAPPALVAGPQRSPEELAKAWLVRLIERTPLADVTEIEVELLKREAPPLIAGILRGIGSPASATALELPAEARERARGLGLLRRGDRAPTEIPRDLGSLQSLLIESLRRDVPERDQGDFARSVERLAEIFGSIQGEVTEGLVRERAGDPRRDELTGLPGHAELHEWLQVLLAEYRRYGHPFAVALVDIEGLGRINDAYGRQAGDRMLAAVATVMCSKIRSVDRAFRLGDDEFCLLVPHEEAPQARPMAERLAGVIEGSQADDGPRIAIAIGISSCPNHGDDPRRLLEVAEEATYAAKAASRPVAVASSNGRVSPQDL
jgi:diguanylate cyclase (GGDEF)-like protein